MTEKIYNFKTDIVIGLEIHIELATDSKLFCSCATHADKDEPNTRTCPVCLGHPGSKPVLNKKAVDYALRLCLALGCEIAPELVFSRKSYFYPDMSKNYQITQYEIPLGEKGSIRLSDGVKIGINRVHMEEDPAALVHPAGMTGSTFVLIDYNRSGDPLCEVVTEPELTSPEQARDFMKQLINILRYLGIFDVNRCIIKADANVSVKESGYQRVEMKNITGFKDIERALKYEIQRQKKVLKDGAVIKNETRAWDGQYGVTRSLRSKETEADYGYIIDPDLVPIDITKEWVDEVKGKMPELPDEKVKKFMNKFKLSLDDARVISADKDMAELFEEVVGDVDAVFAAKWIRRELVRCLNYVKKEICDVDVKEIIALLGLVEGKKITETTGQKLMEKLVAERFDVVEYVKKEGLEAIGDSGELEKFCDEAISENEKAVLEYKEGNEKSFNFIVGAVMRKSKGKADPKRVREMLMEKVGK
ncbi:MAG: Asp-tRNA(Asn)/Glu-tRNA(Gln) amidotransferase subunit GatB [Nanoarchaeota archaeon]|nr:Asp-tRNA(Asn)/Glu-tRNA(Gln) amidotransferase subunit GatB [Nanoarchaeota archaeon]